MKKFIGLFFFVFALSLNSFAQTNTVSTTDEIAVEKKNCVPSKECAKKMGMTLKECKKVCAKTCEKGASASNNETDSNVASAVAESDAKSPVSCSKSSSKCCKSGKKGLFKRKS